MLELDWRAPEILRLYKNAANTRMIIKAMDNDSGIEKIVFDIYTLYTIKYYYCGQELYCGEEIGIN